MSKDPPPKPPKPTDAELRLLAVLWQRGPSTVRDIHTALGGDEQIGYTTVLKLLQIMTEKTLVRRDERVRPQVYSARLTEAATQTQIVRGLLARCFGGSTSKLVQRALSSQRLSAAELAEIRALLDRLDGGER